MHDAKIFHLKTPALPEFRFEWHPARRNVYLVRLGMTPEIGELIAFNIDNEGAAHNAVLIWLRGFRAAKGDLTTDNKAVRLSA
jgi:hypothetical protein